MKNRLLAGNALNQQEAIFPAFNPNSPHGSIMAGNDANFSSAHLSEPLTEFVSDVVDPQGLDTLLDQVCPAVQTGRSFAYLVGDSKENFQVDDLRQDIRPIGAEFAEVRTTGTQTNGRTENKGLTMVLDEDQGGRDPEVQQRAVTNLWNRLLRSELYRVEALLEANDAGGGSSNWGGSASDVDPDGQIAADINTGGDARGIDSNIALYGGTAWLYRFRALGQLDARSASADRTLTPEQVATMLGLDTVAISRHRYQSSATAKSKVVAAKVYTYYVNPMATINDPSNIKRFVSPVEGGGMRRVYVNDTNAKRIFVSVEHYSQVALTHSLGIVKRAVTFT